MMRFVVHHYLRTSLWHHFSSLGQNKLGAEGGKAIGEALKVKTSITDIK
jgi:hypothetical protein